MELRALVADLTGPSAYPHPVDTVEVRHTHISVVFLAGAYVYKVKKPLDLGFLDFTSVEKRRHFCEEEVRLNRRLAAQVYLGVVPLTRTESGVKVAGDGEVVEWAVKMKRLPEDATLRERLQRGEVSVELIEALARRIAAFHQGAEANERIAGFGRFEPVARIIRDIFVQAGPQVGTTVSPTVFARVKTLAEQTLSRFRPIIEARAARGIPRDCHGDLHLDHIYHFPDCEPPADLVMIDCIEFNERFRFIDPVADMAFPAMDLTFQGRRDLARAFIDGYFRASGDDDGRALLSLYTAYRATVRGMVEGIKLGERDVPEAERSTSLERARAHWLLALTELEEPGRKPCLFLVAGLPGTGKSHLARLLADRAAFSVVRSDVVRKELANLSGEVGQSLYTPEWNDRTYTECLTRSKSLLFDGHRVLVDATFREERKRQMFLRTALKWGVPFGILVCQARPKTIRQRLEKRRGDASDADWSVYIQLAANWDASSPATAEAVHTVSTDESAEDALAQARESLRQAALLE